MGEIRRAASLIPTKSDVSRKFLDTFPPGLYATPMLEPRASTLNFIPGASLFESLCSEPGAVLLEFHLPKSGAFGKAKIRKGLHHIWAGRTWLHVLVHLLHDPVFVDIDGPTIGVDPTFILHSNAIKLGHGLGRVAQ